MEELFSHKPRKEFNTLKTRVQLNIFSHKNAHILGVPILYMETKLKWEGAILHEKGKIAAFDKKLLIFYF